MIPTRASAAAAGWSRNALPEAPPPAAKEEDEEHAELSISDQRTLYLVNIFIGNTARFLNSFASLCQDKLAQVHRRILKLDANLTLLEAQLQSRGHIHEFDNKSNLEASSSTSANIR
ncbi:WASH complex subunit 3-like isoform X1 [Zingiber officinale]|uniref:WASH complex subunit CCDC53 n=1 Tax=Zingiber officinale TaxID=94328 RepID=A0A8J5EN17_ZINOF|nr:WASH complex subunit 3-like isoform X1 [Zingiber officinale]KAG6467131.1 hypothetical protein ZIOFF_075047 [Zingiber officinale]